MLYLLKQETRTHDSYKVGFAEDADKRFQSYAGHNRNITEVSRRPGDRSEETLLHHYLHCFPDLWDFHKSEWYDCRIGDDQIEKYFEHPWEDIKEKVWNSRELVLSELSSHDIIFWKTQWESLKIKPCGEDGFPVGIDLKMYQKVYPEVQRELSTENLEVIEFFRKYDRITRVSEKLRFLCEASISEEARNIILDQLPDSDRSKMLYNALGPSGCKADGYNITKMSQRLGIIEFSPEILREAIYYQFKEGDRYSLKDFKRILGQIYEQLKYNAKPKASDIEEFFEVKQCKIPLDNGKRIHGYELLKKLR